MDGVGLRAATRDDREFCFRLHKDAMGEYVDAVWGWDDQEQWDHHVKNFDPDQWRIITVDGADAGMLSVDRHEDHIYLGRIELLPEHQGRGIGTHLITELISEAEQRGVDLVLDVLAVNRRAHALYRRLGLHDEHHPGDSKTRMRYRPANQGLQAW
jgi:ribosomal protein S18 acetylase RimI-like enzyme